MAILYKADPVRGEVWKRIFDAELPGRPFHIWPNSPPATGISYLIAWTPPSEPLSSMPSLRAVFSVGAGISQFDLAAIPAHVPLIRLVDPATAASVAEYVTMGVLALHRDLPAYVAQQRREDWTQRPLTPAPGRRIGFMGLGEMARAAIASLRPLGFPISAWSRTRHAVEGVACHAGTAELPAFLSQTDILVCLLPLTAETHRLLDARLLARLPTGAALLHAGRGPQLDAKALVGALDSGRLRAAMLDVTDPEPLPRGHPLWRHPKILLTPHVASLTDPASASRVVIGNIMRLERGDPPVGLVDRRRGY